MCLVPLIYDVFAVAVVLCGGVAGGGLILSLSLSLSQPSLSLSLSLLSFVGCVAVVVVVVEVVDVVFCLASLRAFDLCEQVRFSVVTYSARFSEFFGIYRHSSKLHRSTARTRNHILTVPKYVDLQHGRGITFSPLQTT